MHICETIQDSLSIFGATLACCLRVISRVLVLDMAEAQWDAVFGTGPSGIKVLYTPCLYCVVDKLY